MVRAAPVRPGSSAKELSARRRSATTPPRTDHDDRRRWRSPLHPTISSGTWRTPRVQVGHSAAFAGGSGSRAAAGRRSEPLTPIRAIAVGLTMRSAPGRLPGAWLPGRSSSPMPLSWTAATSSTTSSSISTSARGRSTGWSNPSGRLRLALRRYRRAQLRAQRRLARSQSACCHDYGRSGCLIPESSPGSRTSSRSQSDSPGWVTAEPPHTMDTVTGGRPWKRSRRTPGSLPAPAA